MDDLTPAQLRKLIRHAQLEITSLEEDGFEALTTAERDKYLRLGVAPETGVNHAIAILRIHIAGWQRRIEAQPVDQLELF